METQSGRRCFVTVGTTSFDKLITILNDESIRRTLVNRFDVKTLIIQYGRGTVIPAPSVTDGLKVLSFNFKPTLKEEMESADLIISHAGAGSIMEALRLRKPLIVVVNDDLMDNHQIELASAMERGKYLAYASQASQLLDVLSQVDITAFRPYPPRDTSKFAQVVRELLQG